MVVARTEVAEKPSCECYVVGVGVGEQVPIVRVLASPQHRGREAFVLYALLWSSLSFNRQDPGHESDTKDGQPRKRCDVSGL